MQRQPNASQQDQQVEPGTGSAPPPHTMFSTTREPVIGAHRVMNGIFAGPRLNRFTGWYSLTGGGPDGGSAQ